MQQPLPEKQKVCFGDISFKINTNLIQVWHQNHESDSKLVITKKKKKNVCKSCPYIGNELGSSWTSQKKSTALSKVIFCFGL